MRRVGRENCPQNLLIRLCIGAVILYNLFFNYPSVLNLVWLYRIFVHSTFNLLNNVHLKI